MFGEGDGSGCGIWGIVVSGKGRWNIPGRIDDGTI